ncbi:MAG: condensation domain-containing protein, partial [Verrucomicrobiota bacterium]
QIDRLVNEAEAANENAPAAAAAAATAAAPAEAPPATPTEKTLAEIWETLLGRPVPDRTAHFFEWGGHSLLVARMAARVRSEFSIELPLRAIFEEPTLEELAARIDASATTTDIQVKRRPADAPLMLTHAQKRQWVLAQLDPGSATYNIPAAVQVKGPLPMEALEQAVGKLCHRHEVLRTVYQADETGKPAPELHPVVVPMLKVTDLTDVQDDLQHEQALSRLLEEAQKPFELEKPPLFRIACIKLAEEQHLLQIVIHHIIGDGWSLKILLKDLMALTESDAMGLPPLELQYGDYAHFEGQRDHTLSLAYWRKQLLNTPSGIDLPVDFPRPANPGQNADEIRFRLPASQRMALEQIARGSDATLFMTLLAAFKVLLYRYSGERNIVIGSPTGSRPAAKLEPVVGLFVNTLALRTEVEGDLDFAKFLKRVRKTVLDGLEHQDVPFEQIVSSLETDRDWDRSPVFQVMFLWQNDPGLQTPLPETARHLVIEPYLLPATMTKFDLTLSMAVDGDELA